MLAVDGATGGAAGTGFVRRELVPTLRELRQQEGFLEYIIYILIVFYRVSRVHYVHVNWGSIGFLEYIMYIVFTVQVT